MADDVGVELVKDEPKAHVDVETRPALFDGWDFGGEPGRFRLLGRDGKEQDQVATLAGQPNTDRDRSVFAPFCLACRGLAGPEVGVAQDGAGLKLIEAHDFKGSSSRA